MSNNQNKQQAERGATQSASIEADLKPCPFCGGRASAQRFGNRDGGASHAVWCDSCHISTAWMHGDADASRAIAAWNRRTPAATTGAAPSVKTWQERMGPGYIDGGADLAEEVAMKAEIADLRAQLASERQAKEYEQRHAVESEKALAQVQAQLAAKGQGEPCGWLAGNASDGGEMMYYSREAAQRECDQHNAYERSRPDFDAEDLREPEPVFRTAPASAQPADLKALAAIKTLRIALVQAGIKPHLADSIALKALDETSEFAGAQPDQRDSAAVTLICPKCGVDRLREECGNRRDCGMIFEAQGQDSANNSADEQKGDAIG